jgi:hypothetical protein
MERRKFVIGLGSLVAGGAAATGTGAFTSFSGERDLTVEVAEDGSGYVGLEPGSSPNADAYASSSELSIEIGDNSNNGTGVNVDSHTRFDDVFRITNQGTQAAFFYLEFPSGVNGFGTNVFLYDTDNPNKIVGDFSKTAASNSNREGSPLVTIADLERAAAELEPGEELKIGIDVDSGEKGAGEKLSTDDDLRVVALTDETEVPDLNPGGTSDDTYDPF